MITKYLNQTGCESAAEKVGSNDDLINAILLELPASSLVRFKSVSKQWLSLITSPHLSRLHTRRPLRLSGLFILIDQTHPQLYKYIPLNSTIPSRTFTFPSPTGTGLRILQSCNGLFFCMSHNNRLREYYVYNPTTCNITTISVPQRPPIIIMEYCALAFDPLSSPHYKLVFVHCHGDDKCQMVVYSSETQLWKVCGHQPFKNLLHTNFMNGVYLNGAIHYKSFDDTNIIYLKIDEERLETIPLPPITNRNPCIYFGKSGGRLHFITTSDRYYSNLVFDVYEMEKDGSKWFVKYQIDLRRKVYGFNKIICIVRGEKEEDSFLVFKTRVDGCISFMKYKFADNSLKMLFEIGRAPGVASNFFHQSEAFEFIQSLSHV